MCAITANLVLIGNLAVDSVGGGLGWQMLEESGVENGNVWHVE